MLEKITVSAILLAHAVVQAGWGSVNVPRKLTLPPELRSFGAT